MPDLNDLLRPLIDRPTHEPPPIEGLRAKARRRARRRQAGVALAVVVAIAVPIAVVTTRGDRGETVAMVADSTPGTPPPTMRARNNPGLPGSFDARTAPFVFSAPGGPQAVVDAYIADRLPDAPRHLKLYSPLQVTGDYASKSLPYEIKLSGGGTLLTPETIYLRRGLNGQQRRWGVVATKAAANDLSRVTNDGSRLTGTIRVPSSFDTAADVVDLADSRPSPSADPGKSSPRPMFGTAGRTEASANNGNRLPLNEHVDGSVPVVQVRSLDGTRVIVLSEVAVPKAVPTRAQLKHAVPAADDPGLPAGFDANSAPYVFTAPFDLATVVNAYLKARFPDLLGLELSRRGPPKPDITAGSVTQVDGFASVPWRTTRAVGGGSVSGTIYLAETVGGLAFNWGVIATTTEGVNLASVANRGGRVSGTILSTADGLVVAADVVDQENHAVPDSPRPAGSFPHGNGHFGTAGSVVPSGSEPPAPLAIDIEVKARSNPKLQVRLVGSTVVALSEVALP